VRTTYVRVENFRAHKSTEIQLTRLGCLIGENNAGKSSVLHAIQFALEDRKIELTDFQDEGVPVVVTLHLDNITDHDLERIGETHREKVARIIDNGTLKIVRSQSPGGKAESQYLKLAPSDPIWNIENLNTATKGKTGVALRKAAIELEPKLEPLLVEKPNKEQVTNAWQELIAALPDDQLEEQLAPFPTGIATAVKPMYPSVIYIESVKDASIEAKSTGASAFAKLLNMLFEEVEEYFSDIEKNFKAVHKKLSRHLGDEGESLDERLPAVQRIESVIEDYVRASFPGVKVRMEIPAPTLPMLLSAADLLIDDGHMGRVSSKGDGLKRSVLFALLRAYADMRDNGLTLVDESDDTKEAEAPLGPKRSYLLLFEEPELYLHPRAQRQLMAALAAFATDHQVLVTTHSPGFFQPGTEGFTRLSKTSSGVSAAPVNLTLNLRDAYQVVRHENNEAAFFAQRVVLVEGDSDTFVYPHLAKLFSKDWDDVERNIMFVKIGGKGNITRYRNFFSHFNVPVHVIADLDAISNGFEHLTSTKTIRESHGKLMSLIGANISGPSEPSGDKIKEIARSRAPRALWVSAQENFSSWQADRTDDSAQATEADLSELFEAGHGDAKLKLLGEPPTSEIKEAIEEIVSALALENTYVLRCGDLEYYCGTTAQSDKVSTAIRFCGVTTSLDELRILHGTKADEVAQELRGIFSSIYASETPAAQ